ncbi:MAG: hypothetical protein EOO16_01205 [Chitinophagaceae bacterium]|nr:MAG: hypothetical protein EOO16_01205 [Chitinophagaceae bacterium]
MKHTLALAAGLLFACASFAQNSVKVKKDQVLINDNPVCRIEKKKKGMLEPVPDFVVTTLDKQPVALFAHQSMPAKSNGEPSTWFRVTFSGTADTIEIETAKFYGFDKDGLVPKGEEALANIIDRYGFFQGGAFNPEAAARFKKDFSYSAKTQAVNKEAEEQFCRVSVNARPLSDSLKLDDLTITLDKTETSGPNVYLTYSLRQGDRQLGVITASGLFKYYKSEAEYNGWSMSTDGHLPLTYEVRNLQGCIVAGYSGPNKFLGTYKDERVFNYLDVAKYGTDGKARLQADYVRAICRMLVAARYI